MNAAAMRVMAPASCRVLFGGRSAAVDSADGVPGLRVALPLLAGASSEQLLMDAAEPVTRDGCTLFQRGRWLAGFAVATPKLELEAAAGELYRRLFAVTTELHLYRIWNYVPQINALAQGLENYHRFCRGRSLAFEEKFGKGFQRLLPSASAVGAVAGPLAIGFLAGEADPQHFENPRQVPAFEYPREYGPRPPSFSRATAVGTERGRQVFISGTAAIRGHATVAPYDLEAQLACTLENLGLVSRAAGTGPGLGEPPDWRRAFKVYLRHAADLAKVQARLDRDLLRPGDAVTYLQADICRADLLVEIEAILSAGD
jgi:chorismate lyase / 3-hydroxybenzoate synthase